jgi:hypothetical protein
MQPTTLAKFLLVHMPHEIQEVSAVSYSNLPMAYFAMNKYETFPFQGSPNGLLCI